MPVKVNAPANGKFALNLSFVGTIPGREVADAGAAVAPCLGELITAAVEAAVPLPDPPAPVARENKD